MNPTVRGFLIIAAIAAAVVALHQETTLSAIEALVRVAFFLAIALFVYMVWRERRSEIAMWPRRAQFAFYGAGLLIVADIGAYIYASTSGIDALAFILVLAFSGFAMWRVWRDQHTLG
jgi:hypothetical protein